MDDPGIHAACCGANTWTAAKGSATVFINGKSAHRMGDQTRHCGGIGQLVEGSPNVIVGEPSASGGRSAAAAGGAGGGGLAPAVDTNSGSASRRSTPASPTSSSRAQPTPSSEPDQRSSRDDAQPLHFTEVRVFDAAGQPLPGFAVRLTRADGGNTELARTDADGVARWEQLPAGKHKVHVHQDDSTLEPH